MVALQDSFKQAFASIISVGEGAAPAKNSTLFDGDQIAVNELGKIIHASDSVIKYTSWIFNLTTAAMGLCALSLVCSLLVFFLKVC